MLIIGARKGKPAFLVKIFRFQPPSLCSRRFFYIKYPFTLDLAQRPPPLKQNKTKPQKPKNLSDLLPHALQASNNVFLAPDLPLHLLASRQRLIRFRLSLSCSSLCPGSHHPRMLLSISVSVPHLSRLRALREQVAVLRHLGVTSIIQHRTRKLVSDFSSSKWDVVKFL